jgi:hypothetical protein
LVGYSWEIVQGIHPELAELQFWVRSKGKIPPDCSHLPTKRHVLQDADCREGRVESP